MKKSLVLLAIFGAASAYTMPTPSPTYPSIPSPPASQDTSTPTAPAPNTCACPTSSFSATTTITVYQTAVFASNGTVPRYATATPKVTPMPLAGAGGAGAVVADGMGWVGVVVAALLLRL